jgi:hypothetical protein
MKKHFKTMKNNKIATWTEIKDEVYGKKGTARRDKLDRDFKSLKLGLMLREAREK